MLNLNIVITFEVNKNLIFVEDKYADLSPRPQRKKRSNKGPRFQIYQESRMIEAVKL